MKRVARIKIRNNFSEPKVLMLEPWAEDYTMLPGDEFEIVEEEAGEDFYFKVVFGEDIFVYPEARGNIYPRVYQDGEELELGHKRTWDEE